MFRSLIPREKNLKMSSDGGKRKRQEGDEGSEGTNFSNDDINQKKIDEIQLKKKVQNKIRCQRYRVKKKSNAIVDLKISKHQTISLEEEEKIKRRKLQDKEKSQRYRDKKKESALINLQMNRSSKTVIKRVSNDPNFHNSQIAGPSTRNVPYVPPIDIADLSTQNEPDIPELHSDSDDNIDDISVQVSQNNTQNMDSQHSLPAPTYSSRRQHSKAHLKFQKDFFENDFGHSCDICDRLWFAKDIRNFVNNDTTPNIKFLRTMLKNVNVTEVKVCSTCLKAINKNSVPLLSVYNGFKYPPFPQHLKNFPLDLVTERLISPRIPFMQIRRLRHVLGRFGIYGQVINVPIEVNTMVNSLPRNIDDDHSISVHIKRKKIHKSNYLCGIVNKRKIKAWLQHLKDSPLYTSYGITVDDSFFNGQDDIQDEIIYDEDGDNDISEQIPIDESLVAQQQTLMWNDEMYLRIAPGEGNVPVSLLFDEHAEELSFPQIYLGQFRTFRDGVNVTSFMMATSELRRSDRRGVTPQHLLYMAMKILRIRIRDSLKHVGKGTTITKEQIESEDYVQGCIESNLSFLRTIPNSVFYWLERKKDLFAMIRQYGKPTVFFTISANEIGWSKLLQLLHNLKYNSEITLEDAADLHYIEKSTLINEDAVTCAIYFNKLVNVLMKILQSKKYSPFKKYVIVHYFKRIEFQHRGSPHAHILAWLDNAPEDALGKDYNKAIDLIDSLISVSAAEASGNIKLQTHKHTFTCYKGIASKRMQKCRFDAPFMPIKTTMILTPMKDTEDGFEECKKKYKALRKKLENYEYDNFQTFYEDNNINSDEEYVNVIRAGIDRPKVFPKRQPHEKWHNPFNPFIMNIVQSNTDFQFIAEEYSCAAYVVEYINKTNRGVSNLQRKIIEVMDKHPEFDIFEITRNISINLLNHTEMTSQEAAWYLLREPMSKSSTIIVYIPTVWPIERQKIKKTMTPLSELDDDCTDIWKENWFDKYEKRPQELENVSLAQFVSKYHKNNKEEYVIRNEPKVIRYRNYDMATDLNEYKREMVTLHIPFRHEESEILSQMKFIKIYDENVDLILQKKKEFESNIDIEKTLQICRELCREEDADDGEDIRDVAGRLPDQNPFQELYNNPTAEINDDL